MAADDRGPGVAQVTDEERAAWIVVSRVPGIGPITFKLLLEHFGSAVDILRAPEATLARVSLDSRARSGLIAARRVSLHAEIDRLERANARALVWSDAEYPRRLREIHDPPPVLYIRGSLAPADELAVAVVGTRRVTAYGREVAERICADLAANRVTIVSGLARGTDSNAHRATLAAGGRTIAVLGSGLDQIYPPENRGLADAIAQSGAIVTEYALGTKPDAANFPPRNRIIAGLSLGVLVVEAGQTSGALITADFALQQGREVFAVPGNVYSRTSVGTNRLIQQSGAMLVIEATDILETLNLRSAPQQLEMIQLMPENPAEAKLLALLSGQPTHVDELTRSSGLPSYEVASTLTMLELKGYVRAVGGAQYILARGVAQ
ncbi:MAG: DNA-protecting protein DprA [Chloroflexi bacterium]|nr:DNA-protecting protein DprA [Chloroflexota bacterium]